MKTLRKNLATTILTTATICMTSFAFGATDSQASEEIISEAATPEEYRLQIENEVEQIEVQGVKPLLYYQRQMVKAELDFYELFNALADEDKYRIKCRKESRVGSRIKTTACYPQYVLDRMAVETQNALNSGAPYPKLEDIEFLVQREKEESLQYAAEIISKHPTLIEKLTVMNQKQEQYNAKKKAG